MAKKKATKKATPRAKLPYDPLASPYKTFGDFDKAVSRTARSQIDPQLKDIDYRLGRSKSAYGERDRQIRGWSQYEQDAAKAGAGNLATANQNILNSLAGFGQDVQGAMAAALRATEAQQQADAASLGVGGPKIDPNYLAAQSAYAQAGNMGLAGDITASNARANANIGIAGTRGRQSADEAYRAFQAQEQGFDEQRSNLMAQLPGLMEQARQNLSSSELARSGQEFQQGLANKEFGLKERAQTDSEKNSRRSRSSSRAQDRLAQDQFGESKRATRVSERQRDEEIGISRTNARTQRMQVTGGDDSAEAEARGKQFDAGLSILENAWKGTEADNVYMLEDPNEEPGPGNPYTKILDPKATGDRINARMKGKFDEIHRQIMAATGMGPGTAYRVMMASSNKGWATHARHRLEALKKGRRIKAQDFPRGNEGGISG